MLRRDRQIRMQIHQLMDACLFALSFWLAFELRTDPNIIDLFNLIPFNSPFEDYVWLYLVLIPAAPIRHQSSLLRAADREQLVENFLRNFLKSPSASAVIALTSRKLGVRSVPHDQVSGFNAGVLCLDVVR